MRQISCCAVALLLWSSSGLTRAQVNAVSAAQRQDMEENQRRLNARLGALEEALEAYQHEISSLKSELRTVREELSRAKNRNEAAATEETLRRLAASIEDVDKKRAADYEKVMAQFRKLGREVGARPPDSPRPRSNQGGDKPGPAVDGKGYEYTIRERDTLSHIVKSLRDQGFNVTQDQIEKANPGVKWNTLGVGKKIFIPAPPP